MSELPKFPSQTDAYRSQQQAAAATAAQNTPLPRVSTGTVVTRKKTTGRKLRELFAPPDLKIIAWNVLVTTIIPIGKKAIADVGRSLIDSFQYGPNAQRPIQSSPVFGYQQPYNMYNGMYTVQAAPTAQQPKPVIASNPCDVAFVEFQNGADAINVLEAMGRHLATFGQVTVMQYYEMAGVDFDPRNLSLSRYGWRSLEGAHTERSGPMWSIALPRPINL